MKTIKQLLITIAVLLCNLTANAYDFEVDGIYYNIISATDFTAEVTFGENKYSGEVEIPSTVSYNSRIVTVTKIGSSAFKDCTDLISISCNSIKTIEDNAFQGCIGLKKVIINCPVIGKCFSNLSSIEEIVLGNNVTTIGYSAFTNLDKLTYVTMTNSVKNIEAYAFSGCSSLADIVISNSVTKIEVGTFRNCSSLTSIIIPNSVTIIEIGAFRNCSSLTSIIIPNNVTKIDDYVFNGCTSLKDICFEDGESTIWLYASSYLYTEPWDNIDPYANKGLFYECPLENLYLGRDVRYPNSAYPFEGTTELNVVIGNTVTKIERCLFFNSGVKEIIMGNNIEEIEESAFGNCNRLTNITIPNSVRSVDGRCFDGCVNLANITIGDGIINFNSKLTSCPALTSIYLEGMSPFSVVNICTDNQYANVTLYVPYGTLEIYQTADVWKNFWNIQEYYFDKYFYIDYYVDGEIYAVDSVKHGDFITLKDEPINEGRAFSGWSEIPQNMPANNIVIMGAFKYQLMYRLDEIIYTSDSIYYGVTIESIEEPEKEGYTFSGWSEIPETMPAEDITVTGSFSINSYDLVYMIDGEEYKRVTLEFGSEIIPEEEPTKEGYTFSGWSEIPEIMPAENVTVTGSFSINSYDLVYMVDNEEYKRITLEFGSEIVPEEEPTKEGYTFSGWSEIPETMPAEDVTVTGSFSINSYDLVYMIDGEEYKRVTLKYGSKITPEKEPEKEGYTFSGWSNIPETMPAHDVEVTGSFIPTNVSEIIAEVSLQINGNNISLSNANNSTVAIYSINGVLVKKIDKYAGEEITLEKGVYIVSVGDKAMKIIL